MRTRLLVAALATLCLGGTGSARADACPTLSLAYRTTEAVLRFELDPAACGIPVRIDVAASLTREGPVDGEQHAVQTSCSAEDYCVVELVIEHGTIEHAVYQGRVDYEAIWDGGFASGGAVVFSRCTSAVALAVCNP